MVSADYRPVSWISIPDKNLECIIQRVASEQLEKETVITKCQKGLIKNTSWQTNCILSHVDQEKEIIIVHLDFSKIYDKVSHSLLLHKVKR